jgi:putative flippase GtrA
MASAVLAAASYLLLRAGVAPMAAGLAAYAIAFSVGYGLQRWWTFEARHAHGRALPRYFAAQVSIGGITALATWVGASVLHWPHAVVSVGTAGLSGALSYLASRYWVFT